LLRAGRRIAIPEGLSTDRHRCRRHSRPRDRSPAHRLLPPMLPAGQRSPIVSSVSICVHLRPFSTGRRLRASTRGSAADAQGSATDARDSATDAHGCTQMGAAGEGCHIRGREEPVRSRKRHVKDLVCSGRGTGAASRRNHAHPATPSLTSGRATRRSFPACSRVSVVNVSSSAPHRRSATRRRSVDDPARIRDRPQAFAAVWPQAWLWSVESLSAALTMSLGWS